jgi:hypothetical protein
MLTGCEWCGVGADDECVPTCAGGVTSLPAGRVAAWLADRFGGAWSAAGSVDLAYVTLGDIEVSVRGLPGPAVVCRVVSVGSTAVLATVRVESPHWVHGARACAGVLAGLLDA